ncbi:unnamed protein product [Lactuca saligna]|uniref:Zinc finger PHD-type domain-containing protein n=1 Tax=Lactuca saligna TaxID=75948 RepID=A0AA35V588_LACSI|nr:unnamed protein product [Lactuca saligna]
MASSEEEGEIIPVCVTNYLLVNDRNAPTSFSQLPLHWSDQENLIDKNRTSSVVYLRGTTDGGLQPVYKEVIAWKLELSHIVPPKIYVLSKGKTWIQLQEPRNMYKDVIKTFLIVVRCLHFAKRNAGASRDQISSHLVKTLRSDDVIEPVEKYLSAHLPLIQSAVAKDKDLAKSKFLKTFLMEIENPGRREYLHELKENQTKTKSKFIVSDDEELEDNDDESDDEDEVLFDSVCAYCDNGGDVLPCEGQCMRSFHPTIDTGVETSCESLGFANAAEYEAIPTFLCGNCKHKKHQCFVCGMLGSSDKSSSTVEVFPCVSATCGHFYHPGCVAKLIHPSDETLANQLQSQIAAGESFTCPVHKCRVCKQGENKEVHDLQFAVCRRCPKAYHRKCLPKAIGFKASVDGTIKQRAWDDLLPKRILMYCTKHAIIPNLLTPKRDHLLFPRVTRKRNQEGSKVLMTSVKSKAFGNLSNTDTDIDTDTSNMPKVVEKWDKNNTITYGDKNKILEKGKSSLISRNSEHHSTIGQNKSTQKDIQREQVFASKPVKKIVKKIILDRPPVVDNDMKTRILKIIKDSTSSFDVEEFLKEKRKRCTHQIYTPQTGLDKTITMGKVEASVKAVRTALKKLEDGGSVEDAKAVCEPNVLNQLTKWKEKLHIFLAPFLIGARYTSFGRHFTKVDKLKEIVERLHWYVDDGDTVVDFCYKNYDLITPKNTFSFEKRDWFSVPVEDLPDGSRLVMGLNPPFGVQASLANKFINHALKFKPKLLILIVPKETKRLDQKWYPYDLIWEEEHMLSGKSFYLPGSVSVQEQPLDDWNVVSPPLSLWSRPEWTPKHKSIAEKQNHINQTQSNLNHKKQLSNYLMEETQDCYNDFSNIITTNYPDISNILDDVPEASDATGTGTHYDDLSDMDLGSPLVSPQLYTDTTTSLPYESVSGFQNHAFSTYHDFANYGVGHPMYPTMPPPTFTYQTDANIWPPGMLPPDFGN